MAALAAALVTITSACTYEDENVQTNDTAQTYDIPQTCDTPDTIATADTAESPDITETDEQASSNGSKSSITDKKSSSGGASSSSGNSTVSNNSNSSKVSSNTSAETKSPNKDTEINIETKQIPVSVWIDVPYYSQTEEMPTGCELVSARMALEYLGIKFTYDEIISYLDICYLQVDSKGRLYGKSPFEAFIGNPMQSTGFGCYPPVIIDMIKNMQLDGIRAEDTSSLPIDFVAETYLNLDIPVLVWVTIGMGDSVLTDTWYLTDESGKITDEKYTWRASEHCMVLVGYDEDYYYFNDPLAGSKNVKYDKELVEKRYEEIGCYSMILRND